MRRVHAVLLALCLAFAGALGLAGPAQAAGQTITNGIQFTDTSGNAVHAHGGGVIKVGSYYYWFGENRNADNTFRYVDAYRSTDLKNWEFRNHVLTQSSSPELATANIERPKVMYNASTGKFVMWMHKENGTDYSEAGPPSPCRAPSTATTPGRAASARSASTCPATSRSVCAVEEFHQLCPLADGKPTSTAVSTPKRPPGPRRNRLVSLP